MKHMLLKSIVVIGLLISSTVMAGSFPTQEPMGGKTFGTSVKEIGNYNDLQTSSAQPANIRISGPD